MKNKFAECLAAVLLVLVSSVIIYASELNWQEISRGIVNIQRVLIDPQNPKTIYAGTKKEILKTDDAGLSWRTILFVKGQNSSVNFLILGPQDTSSVYASTGNGLFHSADRGQHWRRIFKGKNYLENQTTSLAVLSSTIYLGTKEGLFISKDNGRTWNKENGILGNSYISAIAYSPKDHLYIYVACSRGTFRIKDGSRLWEKVFVAFAVENNRTDDSNEELKDYDEEERSCSIRHIVINPNDANYVYLATSRGIYESQDRGQNWKLMSDYGLLSCDVQYLLFSQKSNFYAISKSGIFEYKNDRWWELSLRLSERVVNHLALDEQGSFYAATNKGLFKTESGNLASQDRGDTIKPHGEQWPTIEEVNRAAIEYAEVSPDKIKQWRRQAARKSWLPQVSCGINRDITDLWHWEGGSTTKASDDELRKGRDSLEWDMSLNWDFGELIWNNDQTSIDARSRLMVELRNDILDEVTKLYFERLRVEVELDRLSIEEKNKRIDKEIRLKELEASLDVLTGGYFSRNLKSHS